MSATTLAKDCIHYLRLTADEGATSRIRSFPLLSRSRSTAPDRQEQQTYLSVTQSIGYSSPQQSRASGPPVRDVAILVMGSCGGSYENCAGSCGQ